MRIILIGAGRLATNLAKALLAEGHDILQVYSRTKASAETLASIAGAAAITDINMLRQDADIYIFSVTDTALPDLVPQVCKDKGDKVFLHTAGSMDLSVFEGMAQHYGVFYPMQTFSKEKEVDFKQIPCFIEANDDYALQAIAPLSQGLSDKVYQLASEDRKYLHLAAVFACNFVNHCYAISANILEKHEIPFDVMLPLIDETASKVHSLDPVTAQTGPAVRYDENVMRKQLALLQGNLIVKDIYERMSLDIHRMAQQQKTRKEETHD